MIIKDLFLYKVTNTGNVAKINGWNENNGAIITLTTANNGDIYLGTEAGINTSGLYIIKKL